jgi:hypothetical protein
MFSIGSGWSGRLSISSFEPHLEAFAFHFSNSFRKKSQSHKVIPLFNNNLGINLPMLLDTKPSVWLPDSSDRVKCPPGTRGRLRLPLICFATLWHLALFATG